MLHECISLIYACTLLNKYFLNALEIYENIQISIYLCYVALLSDGWIIETTGTITRYWAFQVMCLSLNLLNFKIHGLIQLPLYLKACILYFDYRPFKRLTSFMRPKENFSWRL